MRNSFPVMFLCLCLIIFMGACQDVKQTPLPILTPGAIEQLATSLDLRGMHAVDWRYDPDRILMTTGGCPREGNCVSSDLVWLNLRTNTLSPVNIPDKIGDINDGAQGPDDLVVYLKDDKILNLYDARSGETIPIGEGSYPSFSNDGTRIAYLERPDTLKIYNIRDKKIEQSISDLYFEGGNSLLNWNRLVWRSDDQAVNVIYTWMDQDKRPARTQIRELALGGVKSKLVYEGKDITSYSYSPDGRLLAIIDYGLLDYQSVLKIVDVQHHCEISSRIFPSYSNNVYWSPSGESIMIQYMAAEHPYLFNVEKVFGASYKELKCEKTP